MKCKLSKLFFLTLIGVISLKGYSQTPEQRKKIASKYDLKELKRLSEEFNSQYTANYEKALAVVKAKNLPINGVNEKGSYFSLKGIDEETGEILYYQTYNNTPTNSSVQTARVQDLYEGGELGLNLEGQSMLAGIWDGGQPQASHQNLGITRVTAKDGNVPAPGGQSGINHATHVSGTIMGNGTFDISARGIAFKSYLWANNWDNDMSEMTDQAAEGLLVSNHSYGIGNIAYLNTPGHFGRYVQDSRAIDMLTKTAEFYLPVYAAGNDRNGIVVNNQLVYLNPSKGGYDLMTNENVGKNPVVVAAVLGITNYVSDGFEFNNVVMSDFSQWGPTDDFRIKPDISAKGVSVYSSAMPTAGSVNAYIYENGTSMAAPSVTGVFTLWQQYHSQLWPDSNFNTNSVGFMKAASLKALMAHTASEAGDAEGPDPMFGWGLINGKGGVEVMKSAFDDEAIFEERILNSGEQYETQVVVDGTEMLTATIAWTDAAAAVVSTTDSAESLLINDLDLRIITPSGDVIMPWALNKSFAYLYAKRADNNVDVIEKVTYHNDFDGKAEPGVYTIRVSHKGQSLVTGSQNYTLVVSGGVTIDPLSIDKVKFDGLRIYPNPATNVLNISADFTSIENAEIMIYDVLGKKVYQDGSLFKFSGDAVLDVSSFNSGVYLLQLKKNNKVETKKIVIK